MGVNEQGIKQKYLFYDDLVYDAGIGHAMCCYVYGLEFAYKKNIEYMPDILRLGHGFNKAKLGTIESFLGLPDHRQNRLVIKKEAPHLILNFPKTTQRSETVAFINFSQASKKFLKDSYQNKRRLLLDNSFDPDVINIAISIRRGDVVCPTNVRGVHRHRLKNEQFYINVAKEVVNQNKLKNYHIHIYSDGSRNWPDQYVDINDNPLNIKDLFLNYFDKVSLHLGKNDPKVAMSHFQHCTDADYFIGSTSGFSDLISILRAENTSYRPLFNRKGLPSELKGKSYERI